MELLPTLSDDFACYTCLRLKPRSAFALKQTKLSRGKFGQGPSKRVCLDCGFKNGRHRPGQTMKFGTELQVYCGGSESLQKRFCSRCYWCDSCIRKGTAKVLRKGDWAKPNGEAREIILDFATSVGIILGKKQSLRSAGAVYRSCSRGLCMSSRAALE